MKKLLLLMCAVLALVFTSCESNHNTSGQVNFYVTANCSAEGQAKIAKLVKDKGMYVGKDITLTADGGGDDLKNYIVALIAEFNTKVTPEEVKALGTGATEVSYYATYVTISGESDPIGINKLLVK